MLTTDTFDGTFKNAITTKELAEEEPNSKVLNLMCLMDKVKSGGNLVFNSCTLAWGQQGDEFLQQIYNRSGKRLNIIAPVGEGKLHTGTIEYGSSQGMKIEGDLNSTDEPNKQWKKFSNTTGKIEHFNKGVRINTVGSKPIEFKN
jgi:hypothetical protein